MWQQVQRWFKKESSAASVIERITELWPTDMHNHLIPGVDDGVKTLDESLTCLRQYAAWGIRRVIATPHISQDYHPNTATQLLEAVKSVQQALRDENIPIEFSVAAEYLLDEQFDHLLRSGELLSFGAKQYVLIETGWAAAPRQLDQWVFDLQVKGYTPILAHPERYRYYQTEPYLLKQLREQGCLLQLNLMSLAGRYGSKAQKLAQDLLKEHCISFIGSDLHRPADLAILQEAFSQPGWQELAKQPLLNNKL
ncbi:tyrosine-protein phosphatase [Fibrella sp. WM1]|uniref:tyrosine-protein phosphatase n=1 Tax=Fibrella musci TaxID=3242485 RepID=UPI003521AC3A